MDILNNIATSIGLGSLDSVASNVGLGNWVLGTIDYRRYFAADYRKITFYAV